MSPRKKIIRAYRWESEFDSNTKESIANLHVRKGMIWLPGNYRDLADMVKRKHRFIAAVRVLCMNGVDRWEQFAELEPDSIIKINDLDGVYQQTRAELLSECKRDHVVDVGWIIRTGNNPPDDWHRYGIGGYSKARQLLWREYLKIKETEG